MRMSGKCGRNKNNKITRNDGGKNTCLHGCVLLVLFLQYFRLQVENYVQEKKAGVPEHHLFRRGKKYRTFVHSGTHAASATKKGACANE